MSGKLHGVSGRLKALLDRLTATRASNLDGLTAARTSNLDDLNTTITSRAAASTALANTVWTSAKAAFLDAAISAITPIDSIQQGTIAIGNGQVSNTATISSVTTSKSICLFLGFSHNGGTGISLFETFPRVALTSSTVVTATRGASSALTATVGYVVVEFK